MAKVRLSGLARGYLRKEAHYLRQRSQPAAEAFLARMKEARRSLGKMVLKRKVRRLKALGLTESLPSGYRLSPRGRAALALISEPRHRG